MMDLFSDDMRRDPYPMYDQMRRMSPTLRVPTIDAWFLFDYASVDRALNDPTAFSSAVPAPENWFTFSDPPKHSRLRGLIARAFTPKSISELESRIRGLSRRLLDAKEGESEFDLATEYSVPLPMRVIAEMLGVPTEYLPRYKHWSDEILKLSYSLLRDDAGIASVDAYRSVTQQMREALPQWLDARRAAPRDDLLSRLAHAEVEGEHLTNDEILGFFQLLLVAGQETTANLINNAMICFMEHPDQLAKLRAWPELLPSAIEEVMRYRAPLQWVMRTPVRDIEMNGKTIPAGKLVVPVIGSANRDPARFEDPERFDIARDPNPHITFGHGIHHCMGAPLARLESRVALGDLLSRYRHFEPASADPWPPRKALHVHGPASLPLRFGA